jgi:hypothetical protein
MRRERLLLHVLPRGRELAFVFVAAVLTACVPFIPEVAETIGDRPRFCVTGSFDNWQNLVCPPIGPIVLVLQVNSSLASSIARIRVDGRRMGVPMKQDASASTSVTPNRNRATGKHDHG